MNYTIEQLRNMATYMLGAKHRKEPEYDDVVLRLAMKFALPTVVVEKIIVQMAGINEPN